MTSIILVNYNQQDVTRACLRSINRHIHTEHEVILIDNASATFDKDGLQQEFPWLRILVAEENLGFGTANNRAVKEAKGEYLLFLNNDTIVKNDILRYFTAEMEKHGDTIGMLGAYLKKVDGSPSLSGGQLYTRRKYLKMACEAYTRNGVADGYEWAKDGVEYVIGADLFMKKSVFDQIGGFDERIFLYFEDNELCYRVQQLGLQAKLITGPEIIHLEGQSQGSKMRKVYNMASLMYCMSKKYNWLQFFGFQLAYFFLKSPLLIYPREWQFVTAIWTWKKYLRKSKRQFSQLDEYEYSCHFSRWKWYSYG